MRIDRRSFLAAGVGALIAKPLAAQELKSDPYFAALYAAAQKEGEANWYIAHWSTEIAERVAAEFTKAWPGVKINVVRATSQVIYQRLSQDMKAGVANCDVFGSADNGHYPPLRAQNKLLAFAPKKLPACVPILKDFDPDHFVTITDTNPTVLAYNTKTVKAEDAREEMDRPARSEVVRTDRDPASRLQRRDGCVDGGDGQALWLGLLREAPCQQAAGVAFAGRPAGDDRQRREQGRPQHRRRLRRVSMEAGQAARRSRRSFPTDGAMLNVGPSSIMASTTHPNAAKLFMEFMLGKEVGAIMASEFNIPVRADVAPGPGLKPLSEMSGIKSDPVELSKKLPDLIEKWRDTFGV